MSPVPAVITAEVMRDAGGHPVAYIDATGIAVFTYQQRNGTYIVDINTRDPSSHRMHVLLDGQLLNPGRSQQPVPSSGRDSSRC